MGGLLKNFNLREINGASVFLWRFLFPPLIFFFAKTKSSIGKKRKPNELAKKFQALCILEFFFANERSFKYHLLSALDKEERGETVQ